MEALGHCTRCAIAVLLVPLLFASSVYPQKQFQSIVYTQCLRNATTSLTPTFKTHLNDTLRNFTSLSEQGSSYAATGSDAALYAMFQCRGDLSPQSCSGCVRAVTALLPAACPLALGARMRLDGCFLRYDDVSFFHLDTSIVAGFCNADDTGNSTVLTEIADVMSYVLSEAPKTTALYASAEDESVFGMAECWRYLNQSECMQCLTAPPAILCNSTVGEGAYLASCDYRYELYSFLEASPPLPSPAPSPRSPSPAPTPSAAFTPSPAPSPRLPTVELPPSSTPPQAASSSSTSISVPQVAIPQKKLFKSVLMVAIIYGVFY